MSRPIDPPQPIPPLPDQIDIRRIIREEEEEEEEEPMTYEDWREMHDIGRDR
jgi:hypothetical protein